MHPKLGNTLTSYKKIFFVGGGTGGHVQPILNIIEEIRRDHLDREYTWLGGRDSQEEQSATSQDIPFISIPTLKLATTRSPKILLYPFILILWIFQARRILKKSYADIQYTGGSGGETVWAKMKWEIRWAEWGGASFLTTETFDTFGHKSNVHPPQEIAVFSKWWPWSVAVGIAAWSLSIPLYIHESDTVPGRSNQILGKIATKIFLGFESAKKYFTPEKCEVIGQILGRVFEWWVMSDEWTIHWNTDKKHLLIICGSQWARTIFQEILDNITWLLETHEIILILGKLNTDMRTSFENSLSSMEGSEWSDIQILDWISQEDIAHIIPDTDIAVTRGSATTLAELTAFAKKPHLIIVPLTFSAGNHQYYNALEYKKLGHTVLEQRDIYLLTQHIVEKHEK
jgi:UDP-N-acetylglucosamine--N-acetylmuramyl-(pentapeptide) pyrophosphoryl-undecaprenol N-acetylglucosamine transferase